MSATKNSSKLVEADHPCLGGELAGDDLERIGCVPQRAEAGVNPAHDPVEVVAELVVERQGIEEQVHQQRLAAANATPQVGSPHWQWRSDGGDQPPEQARAPWGAPHGQLLSDPVQHRDGAALRSVLAEPEVAYRGFVAGGKVHGLTGKGAAPGAQSTGFPRPRGRLRAG